MTNQTAIEWLDRIIDEDSHVYKQEAIEALKLGKEAIKTLDEMQNYINNLKKDGTLIYF